MSVSNNLFPFSGSAHVLNGVFEELHPEENQEAIDSGFLDTRTQNNEEGLYFHVTTPLTEVFLLMSLHGRSYLIYLNSTHQKM